jgi:hypothetical protein
MCHAAIYLNVKHSALPGRIMHALKQLVCARVLWAGRT